MSVNESNSISSFHADVEDSYHSKFKFRNFKLKWTIDDFELVCHTMKVLESPRFPSLETETVKWYLRLEPTPININNEENFRLFLKNTDDSQKHLRVNIDLFSSSTKIDNFTEIIGKFDTSKCWNITGAELYQLSSDKNETLLNEVTFICDLSIFDSGTNTLEKIVSLKSDELSNQLTNFFHNEDFKDVKFIIEDKEFHAHKAILALRSPVFAAMFKNKMNEGLNSIVKIEDIEPSIFQLLLHFIYTDEVENLKESAIELLYAAEKYDLKKLKNMCINSIMYNKVSAQTVGKILELADLFLISKLKKKGRNFLMSCLKAVEESDEYVKLIEIHPQLAVEILKLKITKDYEDVPDSVSCEDIIFELRSE